MTNHSVLACLPAAGPENVFEPIVNRHHDDMRARAARRAQERRKRELVKCGSLPRPSPPVLPLPPSGTP